MLYMHTDLLFKIYDRHIVGVCNIKIKLMFFTIDLLPKYFFE